MEIAVFREECQKLIDRFPELDKDLLNEVWNKHQDKPADYIKACVRRIMKYKVPGRDNITMADFIPPEPAPEPKKEDKTWPKGDGLRKVLKQRNATSLWDAVVKSKKEIR